MRAPPRIAAVAATCCIGAAMSGLVRADEVVATATLRAQALAYEHGEGVAADPLKAADLYCKAALAGDAEALYDLGWMYANGRGVPHDDDIAFGLFVRAARLGYHPATKILAFMSGSGDRVPDCLVPPPPAPPPVVAIGPPAEAGADPFADLPAEKRRIADMVERVAPSYGIDPRLALAVIKVESNFEPRARSEKDARGLMQLVPDTAARFRVKDAFDARQNVHGGLRYLRWLLAYYKGHVALAAAAYNAGEGAVDHFGGIPPYAETRDYVRRVLALFRGERHPFDPEVAEPSPVVARRQNP